MTGAVPATQIKLGVIMLCHTDFAMATRIARVWADGGARLAIHIDAKARANDVSLMHQTMADRSDVIFTPRHNCAWGRFSIVQATLDAADALLKAYPDLTHVYLASGACLPLRPIADLAAYLAGDSARDYIESVNAYDVGWTVGGLNEERFTLYFPFDWRRHRWLFDRFVAWQRKRGISRRIPQGIWPHLGSQWWCLTTETLRSILDDPRRAEFDRYFKLSWILDESYFQTLVRRHSRSIESHSLTLAKFDHHGRPYQMYNDHLDLLETSRCFVARKIWPGADQLLDHFPLPAQGAPLVDTPRPAMIDREINRTVRRHVLGRPGLYMQSRFPKKDAENGKTSAQYAVFQGLSDLYPGFEDWLTSRVGADVHGHLLGPEAVEFAGRPKVGPGAISAHPQLRDHDPQGFLTALIRITDRMQAFQLSPRDNQALNWFIATDPNAHMLVVTGAWKVPLLHAGMPFDDTRRMFAHLQRLELEQLEVLNSVWVKARLHLFELGDFLADPATILQEFLLQIDPKSRPIGQLPVMRDIANLGEMLRRMRNSGLRPRLTGENLPVTGTLTDERTAAE